MPKRRRREQPHRIFDDDAQETLAQRREKLNKAESPASTYIFYRFREPAGQKRMIWQREAGKFLLKDMGRFSLIPRYMPYRPVVPLT